MEPTLRFLPLQPGPPLQGALRKGVLTPKLLRAPGLVCSYMTVSHLNWAPQEALPARRPQDQGSLERTGSMVRPRHTATGMGGVWG